jgi:2-polyprenyl-6-methoxyphenol hydroxylase-like FAD-dependent oxidoreductase
MQGVGIVGAGIAGLHLGLFLRKHGVAATVYAERAPDQLRSSRLPNLPGRWPQTRARERDLGVDYWHKTDVDTYELYVAGACPMTMLGHSQHPLNSVDLRLYQATLLETFAARGGSVVVELITAERVAQLSEGHDLVVIATGGGGLAQMFPVRPEYTPYSAPQRHLCAGLWRGITPKAPRWEALVLAPGCGEIILAPYETFDGCVMGMLVEAIPGGPFDILTQMHYADDPKRFEASVLELLRVHAPWLYELVQPAEFELNRPLDLLQGAITPVVRRGYVPLRNGKFALALGDAHILNDPVTAQGANVASRAAWILGQAIMNDLDFYKNLC